MIIVDKNIDHLKSYPFDEKWKQKMIEFCYYIYSLYNSHYNYKVTINISSHYYFIYKNILINPDNPVILSHIKLLAKSIYHGLQLDYDFSVVENEISSSYYKFLDLFEISEVNINYEYLSLDHILNGYIIGNFLNINPILCCFLSPYVSNYYKINKLFSFSFYRIHHILHSSFGFLKVNFDMGPGFCYLNIGDHKDEHRYDQSCGKLLMFLWKNNFLLKL